MFNKNLFAKYTCKQTIIVFINLFGIRQIEGIAITTSIPTNALSTLALCLKKSLNLSVSNSENHNIIKLYDIPKLFLDIAFTVPSIDSVELVNFLNEKEKKSLMKATVSISKKGNYLHA